VPLPHVMRVTLGSTLRLRLSQLSRLVVVLVGGMLTLDVSRATFSSDARHTWEHFALARELDRNVRFALV